MLSCPTQKSKDRKDRQNSQGSRLLTLRVTEIKEYLWGRVVFSVAFKETAAKKVRKSTEGQEEHK